MSLSQLSLNACLCKTVAMVAILLALGVRFLEPQLEPGISPLASNIEAMDSILSVRTVEFLRAPLVDIAAFLKP